MEGGWPQRAGMFQRRLQAALLACLFFVATAGVAAMLPSLHAPPTTDASRHGQVSPHAHPQRADVFGQPVDHCQSILSDQAAQPALTAEVRLRPAPATPVLMYVLPSLQSRTAGAMPRERRAVDSPPALSAIYLATERLRL